VDTNALPVDTSAGPVDVTVVESLRKYVLEISQRFALELDTREGISIADQFRAFTRNFDTGFGPQDSPDVSDVAVGLTPLVLRNGQLGSHVILPKSIITAFASQPQSELKAAGGGSRAKTPQTRLSHGALSSRRHRRVAIFQTLWLR
jgi:hypothetical protein